MPVSAMVVSVSSSANAVGATGTGTGTGTGGSSGGGPVSRMGAISRKIINKASASFGRRSKNPTRPESSDEIEGDSDSAEDTCYQTKGDKEELDPESSNSANAGVGATIARPQEVARSQRDLRRQDDSDLPGHIAVKME